MTDTRNDLPYKQCPTCGLYFKPRTENQEYCSRSCKLRATEDKRTKRCPICGKEFQTIFENQIYCSDTCRNQLKKAKETKKRCPVCGTVFFGTKSKKYCSEGCRLKAKKRRLERKAEADRKNTLEQTTNKKKRGENHMHSSIQKPAKSPKEVQKLIANLVLDYEYKKIPLLLSAEYHAIYKDSLPEFLSQKVKAVPMPLYTKEGTQISRDFTRIVIGDYGAYIEISTDQIVKENIKIQKGQEYRLYDEQFKDHVKYIWLTAKDTSECKIYYQRKKVDYADYLPGYYYISPFEVTS